MSDYPAYPSDASEREAQPSDPGGESRAYASWGRRFAAFLIDSLLLATLLVPAIVLAVLAVDADDEGRNADALWAAAGGLFVAYFLIPFAYFTILHGNSRGQTVGKRTLGIRVVTAHGQHALGYGTAFFRYLVVFLFGIVAPLNLVDFLWPLWDAQNQTVHDKAAGTVVVRA